MASLPASKRVTSGVFRTRGTPAMGVHGVTTRTINPVKMPAAVRQPSDRQMVQAHAAATDSRLKSASQQADDTDLKHLSPDILSMFHETQKNMLELNKSRLKALEELKEARKTIAELEHKVQAYEKELVALREGATTALQFPAQTASASQPAAPTVAQRAQSAPAVIDTSPPAAPPPPPAPVPVDTITVKYYSGWDQAFFHFNADGKGWTTVPGQKMESQSDGAKMARVQGKRVEFVLTNGKNDWDSPMGSGNYVIDGHGMYKLKSGKIEKLS